MNINVHATVSSNSLGYYRYMRANYLALTSTKNTVKFFLYCLDPQSARSLRGDPGHAVVPLSFGRGSGGHASAIEAALQRLTPGEINVIADTDVVLFVQDWDQRIVDAMMGERDSASSARASRTSATSSGDVKHQQYKKKPTTTWMALSPRYDFSGLKVMPDKNEIEVADQDVPPLQSPIGCSS